MGSFLRAQDQDGHEGYLPFRGFCCEVYANTGGVSDEYGLLNGYLCLDGSIFSGVIHGDYGVITCSMSELVVMNKMSELYSR